MSNNSIRYKNVPAERTEQIALVSWWDGYALSSHGIYQPEHLFHVPNEGRRGDIQGWLMKRQGVRAGVPDLYLAIPSGKYHGLFIEMKSVKGTATPAQKEYISMLRESGYAAEICNGWDKAREVILAYLELSYTMSEEE